MRPSLALLEAWLAPRTVRDTSAEPHALDGHGIFAIVVFAIVSLICIQPISIPLPSLLTAPLRQVWHNAVGTHPTLGPASTSPDADERRNEHSHAQRVYWRLDHVWTPSIGILLLLASETIGGEQLRAGIVGEEGVEPYDVLALFISLAYIAISLDATGLLRYLAFLVCLKAGSSGMRLYLLLYLFFWIAGVLVGNDPVILSGTAFLVYFTRVAGIVPPSAWIWAQFVAANISSAVLVSSNPTNLVVAKGFGISFPTYTAYMALPSLASALAALVAMLLFFRNRPAKEVDASTSKHDSERSSGFSSWVRSIGSQRDQSGTIQRSKKSPESLVTETAANPENQQDNPSTTSRERRPPLLFIPPTIIRPDVDARAALVDRNGAIFGTLVMAATLGTLVGTSVTGSVKVYMVAVPGALVCFARDAIADFLTWRSLSKERRAKGEVSSDPEASSPSPVAGHASIELRPIPGKSALPPTSSGGQEGIAHLPSEPGRQQPLGRLLRSFGSLAHVFPTCTTVLRRLPFSLLPFAFGMFILVQALEHVGFIDIMARGLGVVCAKGPTVTAFFISTLGVVLCNVSI